MSEHFLDEARILVAAGKGGDGCVHFRREKFVPMGGPDGGDGGEGGDVILHANTGVNTLYAFRRRRHFAAGDGSPGSGTRRHGKSAPTITIEVPVGTMVIEAETNAHLADLAHAGDTFEAARGGKGGLGNSHFATSTRQAPDFAEKGEPGEERWLRLEMKLVADVGLVGLPNAGKSTLLSTISAARPKIADYPFTTLAPHLGVVAIDDYSFVVADIPGLIEGAHEGIGLGDRFLRHIQRTGVLIHVVDASGADPVAALDEVTQELRLFDTTLLERPCIVALNKMDLPDASSRAKALERTLTRRGAQVVAISGVTHAGIDELLSRVSALLQSAQSGEVAEQVVVMGAPDFVFTEQPNPKTFTVERKRGRFTVTGEACERAVIMTDFDSPGAVMRLQRQLERMGVFRALQREGVRAGNTVSFGGYELVWGESETVLATEPGERRVRGNRRRRD